MAKLDGRAALATGASSGLGEHFARGLAGQGALVAVAGRRDVFASDPGRALIGRVPQRRLGRMSDLDGPLLLAPDDSAFVTGTGGVVDGGHLVSSL